MSRRTAMTVLLRRGQWLLDDAAFALGGGRCTPEGCRDTAHALAQLAAALEEYSREITPTGAHPDDAPANATPASPVSTLPANTSPDEASTTGAAASDRRTSGTAPESANRARAAPEGASTADADTRLDAAGVPDAPTPTAHDQQHDQRPSPSRRTRPQQHRGGGAAC